MPPCHTRDGSDVTTHRTCLCARLATQPNLFYFSLQPQDAYGLEKLFSEELCKHYNKDFGIECRTARFHNIYGPHGTWKGGREKAPAAFCRKVRAITSLAD